MIKYWILSGQTPIECTADEWGRWMAGSNHVISHTMVGSWLISTVFLGIDHSFIFPDLDGRLPTLFETMVFQKGEEPLPEGFEHYQVRTTNYPAAKANHDETVATLMEYRKR